MKFSEFEKIKKYSESSGSMSVVDSNIKMRLNNYGLFEEKIINKDEGISQIAEAVSPNYNSTENETNISSELYSKIQNINFDERIGYFQSLYAGHVAENNYRKNASSGGMGTWIFKELFDQNLIDYVIHVKENKDEMNDQMFKYDVSSSLDEIKEGAKTRYYPVEISEVMKIVKDKPGRYAIIGIPSFIYSVRLLAKKDPIINDRIKYTVGLICGHQKSTKFAESMAWQVGIEPGKLLNIDFRHKLLDRPANKYAVKMTGLIDGKEETIIKPTSELYGQNWGWGFFKPVASNFTDDVFNETADIVLGDAWLPEYTDDSKGTNIVIVRNSEINELISEGIQSQKLIMDKVDKEKVFESQASHYRHTHDELAYRLYKREQQNVWYPNKRVKPSKSNISATRKKIQDLREELSDKSHLVYAEAVERNDFNYFVEHMDDLVKPYSRLYRNISRKKRLKKIFDMPPKKIINKIISKFK